MTENSDAERLQEMHKRISDHQTRCFNEAAFTDYKSVKYLMELEQDMLSTLSAIVLGVEAQIGARPWSKE